MVRIYDGDRKHLTFEGWRVGAYWSVPGMSGYWYTHDEHAPEGIQVQETPASDDSLHDGQDDDEPFVGPSGGHDTATAALLDRIAETARE
jgi:hypothetical protein